jgi:hypothetical protein
MARKRGLALRDPARPELGWRRTAALATTDAKQTMKGTGMTSHTHQRPRPPFQLITTVLVLLLAALVVAVPSSAHKHKVHYSRKDKADASDKHEAGGVRAKLKHGTLEVKGSRRADTIALRLNAGDPGQIQVDVGDDGSADFSFARNLVVAISVKAGDGDDAVRVDDVNGSFTDSIRTTIDGQDGDDSLTGGLGAESFKGGDDDDTVVGGKGDDTASLGEDEDSFRWDPGDGSDTIDGGEGTDTMLFNGAGANEEVTLTANGERLTFFRDVARITMDTEDVEIVDFNALGGTDKVIVNDLSGTDVTQTNIDLAGTLGGSAGDGAVDNVTVTGTDGDDTIDIDGSRSGVDVTGLAGAVSIKHAEPTDVLSVDTRAGKDKVFVNGVAGVLQVLVDGVPSASADSSSRALADGVGARPSPASNRRETHNDTQQNPDIPRRRGSRSAHRARCLGLWQRRRRCDRVDAPEDRKRTARDGRRRRWRPRRDPRRLAGPYALPVPEGLGNQERMLRRMRERLAAAARERQADGRQRGEFHAGRNDQALRRQAAGHIQRPPALPLQGRPEARGHERPRPDPIRRELVRALAGRRQGVGPGVGLKWRQWLLAEDSAGERSSRTPSGSRRRPLPPRATRSSIT